jgi:2,3-diketo-5-methylthio-1-phosphopentane phosphatase/methylthioribulose-1-phosphate dehydratase
VITAIVTDIEGTTSSVAFVKDVLFPHARAVLRRFLDRRGGEPAVRARLDEVRALAPDQDPITALEQWMDEDRKVTPLKALQGLIWDEAYQAGLVRSHLYADVAPALARWAARGLRLCVFSSGSVGAQRALFAHTGAGDLTPLFTRFFDTTTGAKTEAASYRAIARAISCAPEQVLFLSDTPAELDAARGAGMATALLAREGAVANAAHPVARSFDEVRVEAAPSARDAAEVKAAVVALAHACHALGLARATSGNFSARVGPHSFAITTSGRDKGRLDASGVLLVGLDGRPLEPGRPSAETPLHAALYRRFPAAGAIAHTHSVASTVLSRRHEAEGAITLSGYEMQKALAGVETHEALVRVPVLANSQDMEDLAARVDAALTPGAPAYLVAGHGLTTWGADCEAALRHVEGLEFLFSCELERGRT